MLRLEPARGDLGLRRAPDSNRTRLVGPGTVGINHVETPVSYTLRRPILGANFATSRGVTELAQRNDSSVSFGAVPALRSSIRPPVRPPVPRAPCCPTCGSGGA